MEGSRGHENIKLEIYNKFSDSYFHVRAQGSPENADETHLFG